MNSNELTTFILVMTIGVTGLLIFIFLCHMAVSFMKNSRPVQEFGRREDYPMDPNIHKAQMGVKRARGA